MCDCNLQWLATWLRRNPRLALFTKCSAPRELRNRNIAELENKELKCANMHGFSTNHALQAYYALPQRSSEMITCTDIKPICPEKCWCTEEGLVDCRERALNAIPKDIPVDVTEL